MGLKKMIVCHAAWTNITGSTENLSQTGSGLQRAPSLPRTYRHRSSGIPVLRDSTFIQPMFILTFNFFSYFHPYFHEFFIIPKIFFIFHLVVVYFKHD